ncbi:MAG: hypothetical protein HY231_11560 [Acidobacteria bacterium]|nr:hypothetical protein [Acidobacteriota bacterium]
MKRTSFDRSSGKDSHRAGFFAIGARQLITLALAIFLLGCATTVLVVRAYNRNREAKSATAKANSVASAPTTALRPVQSGLSGPIQLVQFAVYDVAIYPQQVTVSAGKVGIQIEDFSGGTAGLVLEQVVGLSHTQVSAVAREGKFMRGRQNLQLVAGTYEVYAAERPRIRATLIVTK